MNREIKFRGKRCSDGEWVYGSYLESNRSWAGHKPHKSWIVCSAFSNGGWLSLMGRYAVKDDTIGQFTGLEDKNGKGIYEGDILSIASKSNKPFGVVMWHKKGYFFVEENLSASEPSDHISLGELLRVGIFEFEVIDNIYDNPGLIKK